MKANKMLVAGVLIMTLFLAACVPTAPAPKERDSGAITQAQTVFLTFGNGVNVTNGYTASSYSNGTSDEIAVGNYNEYQVWENCSDNPLMTNDTMNVTAFSYQVSPGAGVWLPGAVVLSTCRNNQSTFTLTDKGVQRMRFNVGFLTNQSQQNASLMLALVTK